MLIKISKLISVACFTFFLASPALADVEADGMIFYKTPDNELVSRDATIVVPSRGQGEVTLISGNMELTTTNFRSRRSAGRTVFYAVFESPEMAFVGNGKLILKGNYLRADNRAVYYGDIFKGGNEKYSYVGGFSFKVDIP